MHSSFYIELQTCILTLALVTPRVLVCLSILPGFGVNVLTGMAKRAVAMAIALPAAPATFEYIRQASPDVVFVTMLGMKEAAIGLMLGALLSVPVWAIQSVGSVFDIQRAAVQVQAGNSAVDRDASAVGALLIQAVVLVMMQSGLFVAIARILIESYAPWPAHTLLPPFETGHAEVVVQRFGELFWHIVVYGAPVIIPLLLIEFGFALIGIFAQNLQVSFASSPVKSLTGLLIVLVYWPTLSHYVAGDFGRLLQLLPSLLDASPK